jgi:hypothetical protein
MNRWATDQTYLKVAFSCIGRRRRDVVRIGRIKPWDIKGLRRCLTGYLSALLGVSAGLEVCGRFLAAYPMTRAVMFKPSAPYGGLAGGGSTPVSRASR